MKAQVVYAPQPAPQTLASSVFLAGSIEMGKAEDWQSRLTAELADLDCVIFNPRRPDWDSSWKQTKDDPQFRQQVSWELDQLNRADVIALYLAPGTQSPISLLELGLHIGRSRVIVCCPEGFWRKGNVDIVVERHYGRVYETFETFVAAVREALTT